MKPSLQADTQFFGPGLDGSRKRAGDPDRQDTSTSQWSSTDQPNAVNSSGDGLQLGQQELKE